MTSTADLEALALYKSLMEEVKDRASSINILTNNRNGIRSSLVREYCFLQLRMLCELIVIACLVAHGDIEATKSRDLQKAYHPDQILPRLEALNANFYPSPRIAQKTPTGWHLADYEGAPYLTKSELRKLHGRCGEMLHQRSLRKLLKAKHSREDSLTEVRDWGQKILNLLSVHCIITGGGNKTWVTFLQVNDEGGAVNVAVAEAPHES